MSGVVITRQVSGGRDEHPAEKHYLHSHHYAKGQTYFYTHTHAQFKKWVTNNNFKKSSGDAYSKQNTNH